MKMDERQRIIREIFQKNGEDWRFPIYKEDWGYYDYAVKKIIRKALTQGELKNLLAEKGYSEAEAEEIIRECELRGIIELKGVGYNSSGDDDTYMTVNEEDLVAEKVDDLIYHIHELRKELEEEIKDYIVDAVFDENDEDEIRLGEVYAEQNRKELSKTKLIQCLKEKGYTDGEAEQLIQRYTQKEEEKTGKWRVEHLFRKPEYKPLKHCRRMRTELDVVNGKLIGRDKWEDYYEITEKEEWLVDEYEDVHFLRIFEEFILGTDKVSFRTIKRIFQEAWEQGKKALTHEELRQRIMEACDVTTAEAEIAIDVALRTFKIRELDQELEEIWRMKRTKELKFFWSGTTNEYPPLTTQDRIFNHLKEIFIEARKQGKETLSHEELVREALKTYQKLKKEHVFTQVREVDRELIETLIEDAESLLFIKTTNENGEKRHSWTGDVE